MAMNFGPYGGVGAGIYSGLSAIGGGLQKYVEGYEKGKQESEGLDASLKTLYPIIQPLLEGGNVADPNSEESKLAGELSAFSTKGNAAKKALLANAMLYINRKDKEKDRAMRQQALDSSLAVQSLQMEALRRKIRSENALRNALGEVVGAGEVDVEPHLGMDWDSLAEFAAGEGQKVQGRAREEAGRLGKGFSIPAGLTPQGAAAWRKKFEPTIPAVEATDPQALDRANLRLEKYKELAGVARMRGNNDLADFYSQKLPRWEQIVSDIKRYNEVKGEASEVPMPAHLTPQGAKVYRAAKESEGIAQQLSRQRADVLNRYRTGDHIPKISGESFGGLVVGGDGKLYFQDTPDLAKFSLRETSGGDLNISPYETPSSGGLPPTLRMSIADVMAEQERGYGRRPATDEEKRAARQDIMSQALQEGVLPQDIAALNAAVEKLSPTPPRTIDVGGKKFITELPAGAVPLPGETIVKFDQRLNQNLLGVFKDGHLVSTIDTGKRQYTFDKVMVDGNLVGYQWKEGGTNKPVGPLVSVDSQDPVEIKDTDLKQISDLQQFEESLNVLQKAFEAKGEDWGGPVWGRARSFFANTAGWGAESLQDIESINMGMVGLYGLGIEGEQRLTDEDVERFIKQFPNAHDTEGQRKAKFRELRRKIESKRNQLTEGFKAQGKDP